MYTNFKSFLIVFIMNKMIGILCDCGFPALPVHMTVRPFTSVYFEEEVIQYFCEYDDMHLIGNDKRECSQSKWKGEIPQCVREIPRRSLARIEMVGIKNHTIDKTYGSAQLYYYNNPNTLKTNKKYRDMTYYGSYDKNPNECIHSKLPSNVSSLEWRVVFKIQVSQVFRVDVLVYNEDVGSRIDYHKTESVIKSVFVSEYRQCVSQNVETVDIGGKLFKYSFNCEVRNLNIKQNFNDMNNFRLESINNITIYFASNAITVCELHISETIPFRSYTSGSCGSPDVPLFANYSPVFDQTTHSPIPVGYKFSCDQGFYLEGNPIVLCGVNNKWVDPFPTCLPKESCNMMNSSQLNEYKLSVTYSNLYSFDKNISAINGTQAVYSCVEGNGKNPLNLTLLGDSVRFCQIDGNWSGEEPMCVAENDFTLFLAELNEDILETESKLPKFAQHLHRTDECHLPAIPKHSKVFTYDPELLNIYIASILERIDLMPTYPNGSVITYHCESKFTYTASDFEARSCINGSWVGPIGNCYNPVGGTDISRAHSIQVTYEKGSGFPQQEYHPLPTETDDLNWNYLESDHSKCVSLDMTKGIKVTLFVYLSAPVRASYFGIRLGAKNMFHNLEENMFEVHRASQVKIRPITADINHYYDNQKSLCRMTKVIETGDFDNNGVTTVSFKCDETEPENSNNMRSDLDNTLTSAINIYINPDDFHENFNSTNITFCGIMVFESSHDCGTPENVPNSDIIWGAENEYVRYRCKNGYKLIGNEIVRCSRFGSWKDPFPRCILHKLCEMAQDNSSEYLQRTYYNTLMIDNKEEAVLGTIVEYRCRTEDIYQGLHVMIGPRTAVCTESGKWSVKEPICSDDKYSHPQPISSIEGKQSNALIYWLLFISITIMTLIVTMVILYRKYGCSNPVILFLRRTKQTRRSSTFISYGHSNLRDSVLSFNDSFPPGNQSIA